MNEHDSRTKPAPGWAEHTVVANLPRLLPSRAALHAPLDEVEEPRTLIGMPRPAPPMPAVPHELGAPFAEAEEPRTVVGEAPSRATAQQLIARYAALSSTADVPALRVAANLVAPAREPWFRRVASFAQDDFRRAPKIVRLLLPALPLVAAATTFLDVDPAAPALSRAVAVAATGSPAVAAPAPSAASAPVLALPSSSVTIVRRAGRTLAAEAADAAARGERAQAIAIYLQLAREHPEDVVYASAARILMKDEERNRPRGGQ